MTPMRPAGGAQSHLSVDPGRLGGASRHRQRLSGGHDVICVRRRLDALAHVRETAMLLALIDVGLEAGEGIEEVGNGLVGAQPVVHVRSRCGRSSPRVGASGRSPGQITYVDRKEKAARTRRNGPAQPSLIDHQGGQVAHPFPLLASKLTGSAIRYPRISTTFRAGITGHLRRRAHAR
jgi:hypothetical protein